MPQPTWKSLIRWSTAVALVLSVPAVASAQLIAGTKHDLSATNPLGITKYAQTCVYCHAPHRASTAAPLWNRGFSLATFTMYTATTSATMDMVVGTTPGPVSKACLSCHDGTIALDVITNLPNETYTPVVNNIKMPALSIVGGGGTLTGDHPIAVTYNPSLDIAFNAAVGGKVGVLPLYGPGVNQMECGTCHNVHNNAKPPFLRNINTNSALCLICHIK